MYKEEILEKLQTLKNLACDDLEETMTEYGDISSEYVEGYFDAIEMIINIFELI